MNQSNKYRDRPNMMITLDKQVIKTIHFNDKKGKTYKEWHIA